MFLSAWNKLIFLFAGVLVLILLNNNLNIDSFFGLKQETNNNNSTFQATTPTSAPTATQASPTPAKNPSAIIQSPTPTIIKSIQRIRGGGFEDD